jgi:hypothetical protein
MHNLQRRVQHRTLDPVAEDPEQDPEAFMELELGLQVA